jgi:hypothetical protein
MAEYSKKYFAAKEPKDTARTLLEKANAWFNEIDTNGYLDKIRMMWAAYHGAYFTDFNDSHTINFGGEQGEIVNLAANHIGNLGQHMKNMITATRPSLQARAVNSDSKSLVQARLANGLLDYYMREKRLEDYLERAVEYAVVMGSGYLKLEWNAMSGELIDYDEETGEEIRPGDVEFSNLSPFDVVFDASREDDKHDWVLCRSFKNRYDLMAKYPELADDIQKLPSKAELQNYHLETNYFDQTDLIPVYEFYHRRSESMPEGRYELFLSSEIVLIDSPMPYRDLPVYRISPRDILGTPYGYTPLFDILPIQDSINSLYSTILTNQNAFGVQNILVPRGADVSLSELSGGLNVVEANTQYGKIEPLNLTQTPPEVFNFLEKLERLSETISGINSVTRGDPQTSLKSGNALALVQAMSVQFISGLQKSYVKLVEDVGTGLLNILKDYADEPRVATLIGLKNQSRIREFTGDDLQLINRVIVDIGNPLARTTAGRVEMAGQLVQMGIITDPEKYEIVLNTGRLDVLYDGTIDELETVRKENEMLVEGQDILVVPTDDHARHIREHKTVLADPVLRFDTDLLQRTLAHINEHLEYLRGKADPDMLTIIGEQPLGPPGGSPANQPAPQQVPDAAMGPAQEVMGGQPTVQAQQGQTIDEVPQPATPPAPFEGIPTNPADNMPV